jgi:beta,beta-carotene 9',10'-dioxygenase
MSLPSDIAHSSAAREASHYALGFTTLEGELTAQQLPVRGELPDWLSGTLLRTGPAKFEVGTQAYQHWFDGLAMLHSFAFGGGRVTYSNRLLRSRSYCEAAEAGRIARGEFMTDPCRTLFGRVMAIFRPRQTDNAAVSISVLAGQVVALTETPLPVLFDPETLATTGILGYDSSIGGRISTAHPHHDGRRGYSYVTAMGRRSAYRLFVDEGGTQRPLAEVPVDRPAYMHSFGMSERFLVLTEIPLRVHPLRLALGGRPFIENYRWRPELGTLLTVIDKADGKVVARARAAPCFAFHHVNAHEADGALLVDLLAYPDPRVIEQLRLARLRSGEPVDATARLTRYRIPLDDGQSDPAEIGGQVLCGRQIELPRIDYTRRAGQAYGVVWGVGLTRPGNFLDDITRIGLKGDGEAAATTWHEVGCYPGEPVFVPRAEDAAEDDGVLLSVVLDVGVGRSFLLVLDAATLEECARVEVPHHIPFGLHGIHLPDPRHPAATAAAAAR